MLLLMHSPTTDNSGSEGWPERREINVVEDGKLLSFGSEGTKWEEEICVFLAAHPKSSLLSVVQHLRPDFLSLPAERRAQMWFWVKERLRTLDRQGILDHEDTGDSLPLWFVRRYPNRMPGSLGNKAHG
jgi:hypothetical protein